MEPIPMPIILDPHRPRLVGDEINTVDAAAQPGSCRTTSTGPANTAGGAPPTGRGRQPPMRDDVRRKLAIDSSSTITDRTIDIATTGRRTSRPRTMEIVFCRLSDDIYLSGIAAEKPRDWLVNLGANPEFVVHLKHDVTADLPAIATIVTNLAERRRVLAVFVNQSNQRHGPDSPWPVAVLDDWVERSPLARVTFPGH